MDDAVVQEAMACAESPQLFINEHVELENVTEGGWLPFRLWPAQARVLERMQRARLLVVLKARQLGMTWLALAYALWMMLFKPPSHVLLFSLRDNEATDLLDRLVRMYKRLPEWLRARAIETESGHEFRISNGSRAQAFPTSAGDSYTANLVIVDEADLVKDLNSLLAKVKPTIDAGGKLFLIGRVDKSTPLSPFKRMFRAAQDNSTESPWEGIFLPWRARPGRTEEWYEEQRREVLTRTGALDDLYEQYPETPAQALAPRALDKRLPPEWLQAAFEERKSIAVDGTPVLPGLRVFMAPQPGMRFVISCDPAEGNPGSDETSIHVLTSYGEEAAILAGQIEPTVAGAYLNELSVYYNRAPVLVERNNHGHAVIGWLSDRNNSTVRLLQGHDAVMAQSSARPRYGWLSNGKGKHLMYSRLADGLRDGQAKIHDWGTFEQLSSIDGSTLSAPDGQHDDRATSFALAFVATQAPAGPFPEIQVSFKRS